MSALTNATINLQKYFRLALRMATILCVAAAVGCAGFPSENQDPTRNNKTEYNKDLKECQEDYPEAASGAYIKQWISCMKLKGWK